MNILFLGKPGSGKGTLAQDLLNNHHNFVQLSTGDLLRLEQKTGSPMGQEIGRLLKDGQFATDDMIAVIVDKFMTENSDKSIIFDGYPRTVKQAENCLKSGIVFDKTFYIDVSDEVVKERIVNRRVHLASGRVYNTKTKQPKVEGFDDITGEALTHRDDDKVEVLDNRLNNFNTKTLPIVDYVKSQGLVVNVIDGAKPLAEQLSDMNETMRENKKPKMK